MKQKELVFKVIDDGIGVESEHLERLEEDKIFSNKDLGQTGLGLGFIITKNLSEKLGGQFKLKRGVEEGTIAKVKIYPERIKLNPDTFVNEELLTLKKTPRF